VSTVTGRADLDQHVAKNAIKKSVAFQRFVTKGLDKLSFDRGN